MGMWLENTQQIQSRIAVWLVALLVLCGAGCGSSTTPAPAPAAPAAAPPTAAPTEPAAISNSPAGPKLHEKLVVEGGDTFNFGTTETGQEFEHVFLVKNTSDQTVQISKGPPSCATCTRFEVDKQSLKPNETLKVTMNWRIIAENPEFRQYAPLMVGEGVIKLYVVGKVANRIVISPKDKWNLGDLVEGQQKEFQATIGSEVLEHFDVDSAVNTNPALKVTATPMSPEKLDKLKFKCGFDLNATLQYTVPIGDFKDTVTINIREPKAIAIKVDVTARRGGPLQIFGPSWNEEQKSLGLGAFDPKQELITRLNLSTRGVEDELKFVKVKCPDDRISVEIKPDARFKEQSGQYRRYELLVKVAPSNRAMIYTLMEPLLIEIETNQPLAKTIVLKLRCQALP